jgi:hypothetical protein
VVAGVMRLVFAGGEEHPAANLALVFCVGHGLGVQEGVGRAVLRRRGAVGHMPRHRHIDRGAGLQRAAVAAAITRHRRHAAAVVAALAHASEAV